MKQTIARVRGLQQEVVERAALVSDDKQNYRMSQATVPWAGGTWLTPLSGSTTHGYSQLFSTIGRIVKGGAFTITNWLDAYTYVKANNVSLNDILNGPDLLLPPLRSAQLELSEGDSLSFISNICQYAYNVPSAPNRFSGMINPNNGIYVSEDPKAIIPHYSTYVRQYDKYDLIATLPAAPTTTMPIGLAFPSIAFSGASYTKIFNRFDGTGATSLTGSFTINSVITSNAGDPCTIQICNGGGEVISSLDLAISDLDSHTLPPIDSGLGPDMYFQILNKLGTATTMSFSSFGIRMRID